ncbi:chorismate mutase [Sphingomonas sanguinis]|jgi:isochorismate pyruvate lyase|uniref:chorismate mutase n=1 Tax=Sphingomonas sanguinis TaxID=33051 RepID=A0A7Y7QWC9_9SPHN|nr:chorismate mutase [Sphingomonas sanguinis]MBZ6382618.1 chorismate mutase [Sphingomonas sanguinis]NNG50127.1 chorismate mutase [Sphingomonas sanguinis]NNG54503.1 chorismate mutase [Sphingomonas sanguinis]NVP31917.1 chorismate mutase [Sphingomonas sanguinis]
MRLLPACSALLTILLSAPASAEVPGTPCCQTLGEVRTNIDRIDDQILRLMAERSRYVAQAGRFKTSAATVRDDARIRQILTRIREKAAKQGLNPDVAEATFRAMVEGFTAQEARQKGR